MKACHSGQQDDRIFLLTRVQWNLYIKLNFKSKAKDSVELQVVKDTSMNTAKHPPPLNKKGNLNAVRQMAKSMGVNPKEMGAEAEGVWRMLEDLAENDPTGYQDFIQTTLQNGPPETTSSSSFIPSVGFVVKTNHRGNTTKFFLNVCAHAAVQLPTDVYHRPVLSPPDKVNTNNLQIPLAIGKMRKEENIEIVDVVFNPWVLLKANMDATFKSEVVTLALHWTEEEFKPLKLTRPGKLIKSKYKGGKGVGIHVQAVPFVVKEEKDHHETKKKPEREQKRNQQEEATTSSSSASKISTMSDPMALLRQLQETQEDVVEQPYVGRGRRPLITEIIPETKMNTLPPSAVQKGFLSNTKKALYPTGSCEGREASGYVKLMSKSTIVDLSKKDIPFTHQPEEKVVTKSEKDFADFEFDQLCAAVEPGSVPTSTDKGQEKELLDWSTQMQRMGKAIGKV